MPAEPSCDICGELVGRGAISKEPGHWICKPCYTEADEENKRYAHRLFGNDPGLRCGCEDYPCCGH